MDQKQPLSGFSAEQAMALAQSDAGKKLLALLQETNGEQLQKAMEQAAAGDFDQVKQTLSELLSSPQVRAMLEQMGRQNNE